MPFTIPSEEMFAAGRRRLAAQLPRVELEILRGQARQMMRRVNVPVFLIGTADDCDLVLGDPQFPDVHSYLFLSEDGVWVRHLGVEPALAVEGRLVKSVQLCDGDSVRTGSYEFRVHIGAPLAWDDSDSSDGRAASPLIRAARKSRVRASAGLAVVQELLDETRGELRRQDNRRSVVA